MAYDLEARASADRPDIADITLWEYAYEDDGGPIQTPETDEVPVPSTILLLASGATGLAALRRREKKIEASADCKKIMERS